MKGHREHSTNKSSQYNSDEDDPNTCASMGQSSPFFNQEEYDRLQEEMKTSMNPPHATRTRLEELYRQVHDQQTSHVTPRDKLVNIDFEIPYCTCSGLKVEYLKVEEPAIAVPGLSPGSDTRPSATKSTHILFDAYADIS